MIDGKGKILLSIGFIQPVIMITLSLTLNQQVEKMASLYNIHLRTGCFCNIGACKEFLNLSNEQIKKNLSAGHVCGDNVDLIDGKPTGSVRISFGYMSNFDDAKTFLRFLVECFLEPASSVVSAVGRCDISSGVDQSRHFRSEETEDLTLMSPSRNLLQMQHQSNDTGSNFCRDCDNRPSNLLSDLATKPFVNGDSKTELNELRKNNSSLLYCGLRLEQICLYPIKSCAAFKVCPNSQRQLTCELKLSPPHPPFP